MDATMLAVLGTGLTAIGTGVALFAALWKVQGNRFDTLERHMDKRFEAVDERWTERFEMAENASRERLEAMDRRWTERFEAMDRRFETAAQHDEAAHAAICESIAKAGRADPRRRRGRTSASTPSTAGSTTSYRHLLGASAQSPPPGAAPAGVLAANAPTSTPSPCSSAATCRSASGAAGRTGCWRWRCCRWC